AIGFPFRYHWYELAMASVESTSSAPTFMIGRSKYGKPAMTSISSVKTQPLDVFTSKEYMPGARSVLVNSVLPSFQTGSTNWSVGMVNEMMPSSSPSQVSGVAERMREVETTFDTEPLP